MTPAHKERGDNDPFRESPLDNDEMTKLKRLGNLYREVAEAAIQGLKDVTKMGSWRACQRSTRASLEAVLLLAQEQEQRLAAERSLILKP